MRTIEDSIQPVWYRKPRETAQAYQAFELYRDLGPSRSVRLVAEELAKSRILMERWSKRWNWVIRAREYDNFNEHARMQAFHKKRLASIEKQAELGEALREKAHTAVIALDTSEMDAAVICRMAEVGVKIERLAYGDSTENNANNNAVQFVLSELPPWAASQVQQVKDDAELTSVPASPNARSLSAKILQDREHV